MIDGKKLIEAVHSHKPEAIWDSGEELQRRLNV